MTVDADLSDPVTGQHVTFLQRADETGGELLRARVTLDRGGRVPLHVHARQDETVKVVSGRVAVRVRRRERTLGPGEEISVPRRHRHVVRNVGSGEAEFLLDVRPARRMEQAMSGLFGVLRILRPILVRARGTSGERSD